MRNEPARRILLLALHLTGSAGGLSLDDMAHIMRSNRRTAERARDTLSLLFGEQLKFREDDDRRKRWRLKSNALTALAKPSPEVLAAVEIAAREAEPDRAALLGEAGALLRAALPPPALARAEPDIEALMEAEGSATRPGPRPILSQEMLATLREAMVALRQVEVVYSAAEGPPVRRVLCPYGLLRGGRGWLVATAEGHAEPRLWRLSRVSEVRILERAFLRDPGFSLEAYAARSFGAFQEAPIDVVLRFSVSAAADAAAWRFHPQQSVAPQPDGTLVVRFTAGGTREMCWHLLTWGRAVTVEAPVSLRQELAAMAREAAEHHGK